MSRRTCQGLTLIEVLVLLFVLSFLFGVVMVTALSRAREEARMTRCKGNMRVIGTTHIQYVDQYGGSKYFSWPSDKFNGGEWNASLYWCGLIGEPNIFECPSSDDDTRSGAALGTRFKTIAATEMGYAGRNSARGATPPDAQGIVPGVIYDNFPSSGAMASDDTDSGDSHHWEGGHVAFFDAHVEWVAMATFAIGVACPGTGKTDCLNN